MFEDDRGMRIGTSSWSEKSWKGVFYPEALAPRDYIRHYSGVYDSVEIDATFYAIPSRSTIEGWRERTPAGFQFSAKMPRTITHEKVLVDAEEDVEIFVETMQWLGDRLGPLLFQFPYFNRKVFSSPDQFLERLDRFLERIPVGPRYVVEVRNRTWIGTALQKVLDHHGVTLAWVDQAWMPDPQEWPQLVGEPHGEFGYFRFLGDHKKMDQLTDRWDRQVLNRGDRLQQWIPSIRAFREAGIDVYGYFNNHFAGHAPATLEDFRALWNDDDHSSSSSN